MDTIFKAITKAIYNNIILIINCTHRFLGNKTVILVTHQIQFIKFVDQVVIMEKGKILAEGAFEDLDVTILPLLAAFNVLSPC